MCERERREERETAVICSVDIHALSHTSEGDITGLKTLKDG